MVRSLALTLFLLAATGVPAAPIGRVHVIPTAPTNLNPVALTFEGRRIEAPAVRVEGNRIEVRFLDADPTLNASRRQDTVLLGTLPGGNYEVVVTLRDGVVAHRFPLQVRDVTTIPIIFPWITDSDAAVTEWKSLGPVPPRFRIGGQAARVSRYDMYIALRPEARLPAGLHDVEILWPDGKVDIARNAVEVLVSGDYSTFGERLLLPLLQTGTSADGTSWSSAYDYESLEWSWLVRSLDRNDAPRGAFQKLSPRHERRRRYYVRVRPDGRDGQWTPLPLARESEFRPSMRLSDIPAGPSKRVSLRLYSIEPALVTIQGPGFEKHVRTTGGSLMEPAFALVDLPEGSFDFGNDLVLQADAPIWAMVSSFDTSTRELAIRTP
jgi:hypothetical protein